MTGIRSRHLFDLRSEIAAGSPRQIGKTPLGYERRVTFVSGGTFEGERLSGKVLSGGGDFVIKRPDGGLHLDVRLVLETNEGESIYLTYGGRRNGSPEVLRKISAREPIPAGEDYFRASMQFETSAPRLLWLNDILAIGLGEWEGTGAVYKVHEVL